MAIANFQELCFRGSEFGGQASGRLEQYTGRDRYLKYPRQNTFLNLNSGNHSMSLILSVSPTDMAYLSTAKISMPEVLLFPYLKVISSGCFFLDVILTTELSACRDCM